MKFPARLFTTARGWSWVFAALSAATVVFWLAANHALNVQDDARAAAGAFVCGLGAVMLMAACLTAAALMSLLALVLGVVGYWRTPGPRPLRRGLELVAVAHVLVLGACAWGVLVALKLLG